MKTDRHHRKPKTQGGEDNKENISRVPRKQHDAWHILFQNHNPQVIAFIINETWLDPDYEFVVRRKE